MKTHLSYLLFLLAAVVAINASGTAQGIYQLWGTTQIGGANNAGVLFCTKYDATNLQKMDMITTEGRSPSGKLLLYNGKLYGLARYGGAHNLGALFEYDLITKTYTKKVDFNGPNGSSPIGGALVELNNKLYGLTTFGGKFDKGVLFEYDPVSNALLTKLEFNVTNGQFPKGGMIAYNNKLYGLTSSGNSSGGGVLFEYDPASNIYKARYEFGKIAGDARFPGSNLLLHNNKFYCLTGGGGTNTSGTIFEYDPSASVGIIRYSFLGGVNGASPSGSLSVYNNKLYGFAAGGSFSYGLLFDFDLASNTFTKRFDYHWNKGTGTYPSGSLIASNGKLYGLTAHDGSTIHEFNPNSSTLTVKTKFTGSNGSNPEYVSLIKVPAPVATGNPGSCQVVDNIVIDATNANDWVPITNTQGDAVAEINANGNLLGTVTTELYVHNAAVRKDGSNRPFLDRNITITPQFQPSSPVSIRLYLKGAEFQALKEASNASGLFTTINTINDIGIFKNSAGCSNSLTAHAIPVAGSSATAWGLYNDYIITASISSFSTFYFASLEHIALPIKLASFMVSSKNNTSTLQWITKEEADGHHFEIEHSADGNRFISIATIPVKGTGSVNNYYYQHQGLPEGTHYYRVKMVNRNGHSSYSEVRTTHIAGTTSFYIQLQSSPALSKPTITVTALQSQQLQLSLYNSNGQQLWKQDQQLSVGIHKLTLPAILPKGYYTLLIHNKGATQRISFIKQ